LNIQEPVLFDLGEELLRIFYTWQDPQDVFTTQLNSDSFGGYSDWRTPTIIELSILINADAHDHSINMTYFPSSIGNSCSLGCIEHKG